MLTRITFITVVVVAVAWTVALTLWPALRLARPQRAIVLRAAGRGVAILGVAAARAGSCSSISTGTAISRGSAVCGLETVQARGLAPGAASGPLVYLLHPYTWWTQFLQLVAPVPPLSNDAVPYMLMTATLLVVLVLAAVVAVRRRGAGLIDRPGAVTPPFLAVLFAASMAKLAAHVSNRGGANQRYLLDAIELGGSAARSCCWPWAGWHHAVALAAALGATGVNLCADHPAHRRHRRRTGPHTAAYVVVREHRADRRAGLPRSTSDDRGGPGGRCPRSRRPAARSGCPFTVRRPLIADGRADAFGEAIARYRIVPSERTLLEAFEGAVWWGLPAQCGSPMQVDPCGNSNGVRLHRVSGSGAINSVMPSPVDWRPGASRREGVNEGGQRMSGQTTSSPPARPCGDIIQVALVGGGKPGSPAHWLVSRP